MAKYLKTTDKAEVNDYPYGRLKCTAFFSIEFDKKKGFRSVFQTINPKTGRLNAPKKSTYSQLIVLQDDNGFITSKHLSLNGVKEINNAATFIGENFELFTPEQIEHLYLTIIAMCKVSMYAAVQYGKANVEALKPIFRPTIDAAVKGANTKENVFNLITIDVEAYEGTKNPEYNPFTIKETFTIGG